MANEKAKELIEKIKQQLDLGCGKTAYSMCNQALSALDEPVCETCGGSKVMYAIADKKVIRGKEHIWTGEKWVFKTREKAIEKRKMIGEGEDDLPMQARHRWYIKEIPCPACQELPAEEIVKDG